MSKSYPLARLLRLKRIREDQAAADLALATRRAQQAEAKATKAEAEFLGTSLSGAHTQGVWASLVASRMAGRSVLSDALSVAQVAQNDREVSVAHLENAHREVAVLEKLEENFTARAAALKEKEEAADLDEVAARTQATKELNNEL